MLNALSRAHNDQNENVPTARGKDESVSVMGQRLRGRVPCRADAAGGTWALGTGRRPGACWAFAAMALPFEL